MITVDDLASRLTCTVEEAAEALGIGRSAAYAAVRRDEIPHLTLGRRVLVKVPALLELVGAHTDSDAGDSTSPATAQHSIDLTEEPTPHGAHHDVQQSNNVHHLPGR